MALRDDNRNGRAGRVFAMREALCARIVEQLAASLMDYSGSLFEYFSLSLI